MTFRLLTREEIATIPGIIDPIPESLFAMGVVDEAGVVCALPVFLALCGDPLYVRPDKRGTGRILYRLWQETANEIARRGGRGLRVTMTDTNPGQPVEGLVARMCRFVGGKEIKARTFLVPVKE